MPTLYAYRVEAIQRRQTESETSVANRNDLNNSRKQNVKFGSQNQYLQNIYTCPGNSAMEASTTGQFRHSAGEFAIDPRWLDSILQVSDHLVHSQDNTSHDALYAFFEC